MKRLQSLAVFLGICCWLVLAGCSSPEEIAEGQRIDRARFLLADDELPPTDRGAWVEVSLPDNWSATRRLVEGIGWYRMTLNLGAADSARMGVLVPRLSMNGEFFVNGVRVLSGGRMAVPVTRNWNMPFYVEVPASLLRPGPNVLDIRVFAYRNNNGGLGRVYWGDAPTLQARYQGLYALHEKGAILSFAVAMVAAFIGIVTWLRMNHDAAYGLFGLAMVAWSIRYANYFVHDVPFNPMAYSVLVNSAQGWFFIFFTQFLLRLSRLQWPWLERALYTMGVLGTAAILAAFQGWAPIAIVIALWACVWIPGALATLHITARHAIRTRTVLAVLAAVVAWLYVPLTIRELLITSDLMPFDASYLAHYVGVPLAILISWMLVDRMVAAGQAAAVADLARAQAAFDERQRITQDMHDGLGLQLNSALRVVERSTLDREKVAHLLRACLDELRLIVDSSASQVSEFLPLLASFRIRLQSRLEAIGIQIKWQMDEFPADMVLPPSVSLQVLRIVQEAINNTVKHAEASVIEFHMAPAATPDHIGLVVSDNGSGFSPDASHPGRGLSGMRRRATAAGVGLGIQSNAHGTSIQIDIPTRTSHSPDSALFLKGGSS